MHAYKFCLCGFINAIGLFVKETKHSSCMHQARFVWFRKHECEASWIRAVAHALGACTNATGDGFGWVKLVGGCISDGVSPGGTLLDVQLFL